MSELEKPKRKFWQFHLSTAVLMMFVVGGQLWTNTSGTDRLRIGIIYFGWPIAFYGDATKATYSFLGATESAPLEGFSYLRFAENAIVNLAILAALAFLFETRIRRRESRRP